jgi:hypothetical protein
MLNMGTNGTTIYFQSFKAELKQNWAELHRNCSRSSVPSGVTQFHLSSVVSDWFDSGVPVVPLIRPAIHAVQPTLDQVHRSELLEHRRDQLSVLGMGALPDVTEGEFAQILNGAPRRAFLFSQKLLDDIAKHASTWPIKE